MSLLGAVAYATLTRLDAAVYVVALQRRLRQSKIIHVKRLNAVVRWLKRTPKEIVYKQFPPGPTALLMISDSAFKKEEESGHALKGALYVRVPASAATPVGTNPGLTKAEKGKSYVNTVAHIVCLLYTSPSPRDS